MSFGGALDAHFDRMLDEHLREPDCCPDCDHYEDDCTCEYDLSSRKEDAEISRMEDNLADRQAQAEDEAQNYEVDWESPY